MANPSSPAAPLPPSSAWLAARVALAAALVVIAVLTVRITRADIRAELELGEAHRERRIAPQSMKRETNLRRAHRLNPHNPSTVFELADFLVGREKRVFNLGQVNVADVRNFEESSALLERSLPVLPFRPTVLRRLGELHIMMATLYDRQGDNAAAIEASAQGFEYLSETVRLLPRPLERNEDFNFALFLTAHSLNRNADALARLREIERAQQRYALFERRFGEEATSTALRMGLHAHLVRDMRDRLAGTPNDRSLLRGIELAGRDLDLNIAVARALASLEDHGNLSAEGREVLARVESRLAESAVPVLAPREGGAPISRE